MKAYRVKIEFVKETMSILSNISNTSEDRMIFFVTEMYRDSVCASVIMYNKCGILQEDEDDKSNYEKIINYILSSVEGDKSEIKSIKAHRMKLEKFKLSFFKYLVQVSNISSAMPKYYNDLVERINKSNNYLAIEYNSDFKEYERFFKEPEGYAHTKFKIIYTGNNDTINPDIEIPDEALLNKELIENLELIEKSYKNNKSLSMVNTNFVFINSFGKETIDKINIYINKRLASKKIIQESKITLLDFDEIKNDNGDINHNPKKILEENVINVINMPFEYYYVYKNASSDRKDPPIHDGVDITLYNEKGTIKKYVDKLVKDVKDKSGKAIIIFLFNKELDYDKNRIIDKELSDIKFKVINFNEVSRDNIDLFYQRKLKQDGIDIDTSELMEKYKKIGESKFEKTNIRILDNIYREWKNELLFKTGKIEKREYLDNKDLFKTGFEMLDELKEQYGIKERIKKVCATFDIQRIRNEKQLKCVKPSNHMAFLGNPGTGKTTIARIFAKILYEKGIVDNDKIIEIGKTDLIAKWIGWTEEYTKTKIDDAIGGVLFIDEAYSIAHDRQYGNTIIDILVKEMENNRDKLVVILAGYKKEMDDLFELNSGLKSRINNIIEFEDYSLEGLKEIAKNMAKEKDYTINEEGLIKIAKQCEAEKNNNNFGNARFIRNLIDGAIGNQAIRLGESNTINDEDIILLKAEDIPEKKLEIKENKIGFVA